MEIVVVERSFESPTRGDEFLAGGRDVHGCLEAHRVTLLQSHLSEDGRRMLCIFEAPDAESVRIANLQAGLSFVRVWTADVEEGD